MRTLSYPLLALILVGCQPSPQAGTPPARTADEMRADLNSLRAEYQDLANAGNAAAVADLYTTDAVLVEPDGTVLKGREAIAQYLGKSLQGASDLVIQTSEDFVHGDVVAAYGTFSETVLGTDGPLPMSGMWQMVGVYAADGSLKIRLHMDMIPAELGPPT
jgi:uncharacterized protein (TIGR02246 family)